MLTFYPEVFVFPLLRISSIKSLRTTAEVALFRSRRDDSSISSSSSYNKHLRKSFLWPDMIISVYII